MPWVWWTHLTSSATSVPGNRTALRMMARLCVPLPSKMVPERTKTFFFEVFFKLTLLMVPLSNTSTWSVSGSVMYCRSCEVSRRMGRMQASDDSFGRSGLPNRNPMDSSETASRMEDVERVLGVIRKGSPFLRRILPPEFQVQFTPLLESGKTVDFTHSVAP